MTDVALILWHPLHGDGYQLWSGILGSFATDLGTWVAVAGAMAAWLHHHNCHARGCWRLGKHPLDGTPYVVCRHHHPHVPNVGATAEQIHEHFRRAHGQSGAADVERP